MNRLFAGLALMVSTTTMPARADDAASQPSASKARPAGINLLGSCRPSYPQASVDAHAQGVTKLHFSIDATGKILNVAVSHEAGRGREYRLLDRTAIDALSRCPIRIGLDNLGQPVAAEFDVTYVWTLQ